jgi:hypothetical protein
VVTTGGSSLIPAVQRRIGTIFPHLDEYRLLRYDPTDRGGVESAITEVAKGLVHFGDRVAAQGFFEQIALWDVDLSIGGRRGLRRVLHRGTPYQRDVAGSPELQLNVPLDPLPGQGTSLGLYENQLGPRFMFGLSDLPPLPEGTKLQVVLRPEALLPAMRVVGPDGRVLLREIRDPRRKSEWLAEADVPAMGEERLVRYFEEDADYHPINGYNAFESSPLVRRLRVGDLVEWCVDTDGAGPGRSLARVSGELTRIRNIATGGYVQEMASMELSDYVFSITDRKTATTFPRRGEAGALRLSPRPWKEF